MVSKVFQCTVEEVKVNKRSRPWCFLLIPLTLVIGGLLAMIPLAVARQSTRTRHNRVPAAHSGRTDREISRRQPSVPISFEERLLAAIPSDLMDGRPKVTFSPDGTKVAYVAKQDNMEIVRIGNRQLSIYDQVGELKWSPDGTRLAYCAKRGRAWFVVVDGKEQSHHDYVAMFSNDLVFSPDSRALAYPVTDGDRHSVVLNGRQKGPHYSVSDLTFSPDSHTFAYIAADVLPETMELNQSRSGDSREIVEVNGRQHYIGRYVVVNGVRNGEIFVNILSSLTFSADRNQVIYRATGNLTGPRECGYCLVTGSNFQQMSMDAGPFFSADRRVMAYVSRSCSGEHCRWSVIVGNRAGRQYDGSIQSVSLSADGSHVAYAVSPISQRTKEFFVVVDGEAGPRFSSTEYVSVPVFSPDGKRIAYYAGQAPKVVAVVDGKPGAVWDYIAFGWLTFSPDSRSLAYVARKGGESFLVAGGLCSSASDEIFTAPVFDASSARIAYGARVGTELWWKVMKVK